MPNNVDKLFLMWSIILSCGGFYIGGKGAVSIGGAQCAAPIPLLSLVYKKGPLLERPGAALVPLLLLHYINRRRLVHKAECFSFSFFLERAA